MLLKNEISEIENFIISNGDRFKIKAFKNGLKVNEEVFTPIQSLVQEHQSLANYLNKYLSTIQPEKVVVITKKFNGSQSGGRDPIQHVFHIPVSMYQEKVQQPSLNGVDYSNNINSEHNNANKLSYEQAESTINKVSLGHMYQFQIDSLNRELNKERTRADKYENLHHDLREKNFDLDKQLKTFEEKKSLEMERERLKQENSLSSVIKEVKPELFGLLGTMMQHKASIPQQSSLQGVENEKLNAITETLTQLPAEMQNEAIEVLIRYLNTDATERGKTLQLLRSQTPDLNEQITELTHA